MKAELLSQLPPKGTGTVVGLLICCSKAIIYLVEKYVKKITVQESDTEYDFVRVK